MGGLNSGDYERHKPRKTQVGEVLCLPVRALLEQHEQRQKPFVSLGWPQDQGATLQVISKRTLTGFELTTLLMAKDAQMDLWADEMETHDLQGRTCPFNNGLGLPMTGGRFFGTQSFPLDIVDTAIGTQLVWCCCFGRSYVGGCDQRRDRLYWKEGCWACRKCQGLAYPSQNQSVADRNFAQAHKIRHRLIERMPVEQQKKWREMTKNIFPDPAPHMNGTFYHALRRKWLQHMTTGAQAAIAPLERDVARLLKESHPSRSTDLAEQYEWPEVEWD